MSMHSSYPSIRPRCHLTDLPNRCGQPAVRLDRTCTSMLGACVISDCASFRAPTSSPASMAWFSRRSVRAFLLLSRSFGHRRGWVLCSQKFTFPYRFVCSRITCARTTAHHSSQPLVSSRTLRLHFLSPTLPSGTNPRLCQLLRPR